MGKMKKIIQSAILLSVLTLMNIHMLQDGQASSPHMKNQDSKPSLSGQILINIFDYEHRVFEFSVKPPDKKIIKTHDDDKCKDNKALCSPLYHAMFKENLWYDLEKKHELQEALGTYNLDKLSRDKLRKEKSKENRYQYYLVPVEKKDKDFYSRLLYPNRQFTHVVCLSGGENVLINLSTKEVSFPFSDKLRVDALGVPIWNVKGDTVAYISETIMGECYEVIVVDVTTHKTLLLKEREGRVDCMAFSPDDKYLAVIRHTKRPGFWPHEVLLLLASHGIFYQTYYLEIFDLQTGNQIFGQRLQGSYKNAMASIVWIKGDQAGRP